MVDSQNNKFGLVENCRQKPRNQCRIIYRSNSKLFHHIGRAPLQNLCGQYIGSLIWFGHGELQSPHPSQPGQTGFTETDSYYFASHNIKYLNWFVKNLGISYLWVCGFFEIILESSGIQGNSDLLAYLEIPYANFQNILDFHQIPKSFWNQLIVLAISWFMGLVRWIPYNVKSTDFWKK